MPKSRLVDGYRLTALVFLNTIVVVLSLNAIAWLAISARWKFFPPKSPVQKTYEYFNEKAALVYPGWSAKEIDELLAQTWSRPRTFDAFTQFKEAPYKSKYVNIHEAGFRYGREQGAWPPPKDQKSVFVFGGSTTFSSGLPDWETVPSQLQSELKGAKVYNFGRTSYYSSQERVLLEKLLLDGHVPDKVVFIDGLNEFSFPKDEPDFSPTFASLLDGTYVPETRSWWMEVPLVRVLKWTKDAMSVKNKKTEVFTPPLPNVELNRKIIQRYLANKKIIEAIAERFGFQALFVWQPIPLFAYDRSHHVFDVESRYEEVFDAGYAYPEMKQLWAEGKVGKNFVWCAEILKDFHGPAFVDLVHYTAETSLLLAKCISRSV